MTDLEVKKNQERELNDSEDMFDLDGGIDDENNSDLIDNDDVFGQYLDIKENENNNDSYFSPTKYEDVIEMVDCMKNGINIIVNLENMSSNLNQINEAKRIIDYLCGASYALNYTVSKVSRTTFTFTK